MANIIKKAKCESMPGWAPNIDIYILEFSLETFCCGKGPLYPVECATQSVQDRGCSYTVLSVAS